MIVFLAIAAELGLGLLAVGIVLWFSAVIYCDTLPPGQDFKWCPLCWRMKRKIKG